MLKKWFGFCGVEKGSIKMEALSCLRWRERKNGRQGGMGGSKCKNVHLVQMVDKGKKIY